MTEFQRFLDLLMILHRFYGWFCFAVFSLFFLEAQEFKDDPQVDAEKLKKALDALENKQEITEDEGLKQFQTDIAPALASEIEAAKFYQKCVKKVDFEGIKGEGPEWTDWLSKNQAMMSDENFLKWNFMVVQFLDLWSQSLNSKDITLFQDQLLNKATLVQESLLKYEKEKSKNNKLPDYRAQSIQTSMSGSYYVKAYRIEGLFKDSSLWNISLGQPEGILEKMLMDQYRSKKDARLFDIWEKRIQMQENRGKILELKKEKQFELENQVLELQWKMAGDLKRYGLQNKAINLMYTILSKAPDHPQFDAWIKELRAELGGSKK